ncbi:hypothetical protein ACUXAV_000684 [Cupriavidus metallidurans]|uniref:hypothetical protein n=1 Tax=Cupriavidus metallidurans TaxID=119219 RepID=UPI0004937215|nr:hypothetical protein [Cupriavidus metallidurans]MDE4918585.1 hypothetical protein [Cupriavidus metallidurans]
MPKTLIALAAALLPCVASAVTLEVGAGVAKYETRGDMMWYQEGLQHSLDMSAPTFEIGLTDTAYQWDRFGLDWHAGYVYLGNVHSDAQATADQNYSRHTKTCIGACWYRNRFVGNGHMQGLKLTLEPNYTWHGVRVGIEGGVYAFVHTWNVNVYTEGGQVINTSSDHKVRFAPVLGLSVGNGNFSVVYTHYFSKTNNDPMFAIWKATDTITLRYKF